MVRREEQQWHNRALLLIDTRRRAYLGSGPGSPFEFAVSAAASIGVHLAGQGIETRLVTDSGEVTPAGPAAESLLERLAVIQPIPQHRSRPGPGHAARQQPRAGHRGVRDACRPAQARLLAASHQGTTPAMALMFDGLQWDRGGPRGSGPGRARPCRTSSSRRGGGSRSSRPAPRWPTRGGNCTARPGPACSAAWSAPRRPRCRRYRPGRAPRRRPVMNYRLTLAAAAGHGPRLDLPVRAVRRPAVVLGRAGRHHRGGGHRPGDPAAPAAGHRRPRRPPGRPGCSTSTWCSRPRAPGCWWCPRPPR